MQGGQWKRRRRRKNRFRRFRWERLALAVASVGMIVFALVEIIGYGKDYLSARRTADSLRQAYQTEPSAPEITAAPVSPPPATAALVLPEATAAPVYPPPATAAPALALEPVPYPDNPSSQINKRFKALRKENKDIVGWLTLGNLLDEAVVQRDEEYYMNHDALGQKNVNGAIFLDSGISLKTRPYALILYGHNMKTGAMFGCLRNYENLSFYHSEPFITFDTLYESGRYVIFAVGKVNTVERVRNYVDFIALRFLHIQERQNAIDELIKVSVYSCPIDVRPDDQLLVLVTCVENENERRVVAARRVRDGEDEAELKKIVERSWKKP